MPFKELTDIASSSENLSLPAEPSANSNNPFFDQTSGTIDQRRRQTQTAAERALIESLLPNLILRGVSGEVSIQELLIVPLSRHKLLNEASQAQLKSLLRKHNSANFSLRQPDIYIERYGIVVEIDGIVHDLSDHRIRRDSTRDAEYALLGLHCLVVSNRQVYDPDMRGQLIRDILTFIEQEKARPDFIQRYQRRRTAISRARSAYRKTGPSINAGAFNRGNVPLQPVLEAFKGRPAWGGLRVNLAQGAQPKKRTKRAS